MIRSPYIECPSCHQVVDNSNLELLEVNKPAPCCGAAGEARIHWPSIESLKFLEIVESQDLSTLEGRRIAIVFLSTMMEVLLEDTLWYLLNVHAKTQQLKDLVLDQNRGRERRIKLYNKLSTVSLGDLLSSQGLSTFLEDWKKLSDLRDGIVHGHYYKGTKDENDIIKSVKDDCLKSFKVIHNDVQKFLHNKSI